MCPQLHKNSEYIKFYYSEDINPYSFLLEAGQGKNINGNMYAFLHEMRIHERWDAFSVYLVVCEDTIKAAKERVAFYGYKNVKFVIRESLEYKKLLASCKYLLTDNSFPPYYIKKDNQVVLNTWHGTPLKTLGRCDIENSSSIANVQKNFLMSDYVLFPNEYTMNVFMEDYCLKNIMNNLVILADYPRNVAFFNDTLKAEIKMKYNLNDKEVFAYMPTWRGSSRNANVQKQKKITLTYLKEIDQKLNDNQVLYVNLHFLIGNQIDLSKFKHIEIFPKEYETYDFLNVCDVLITDYSSVFFDFAVSKKKIILFTYDLQEYIDERGMYFSIDELPFPKVDNVNDLIAELNIKEYELYHDFSMKFCKYASKDVVKNILELLVDGKKTNIVVQEPFNNGLENIVIHVDNIKNAHRELILLDYIQNIQLQKDKNYIVLFKGKITTLMADFIKKLPNHIQILGYVSKNNFTLFEKIALSLSIRFRIFDIFFKKIQHRVLKRETYRRLGHTRMDHIFDLMNTSYYIGREFIYIPCPKTSVVLDDVYVGVAKKTHAMKQAESFKERHYDDFQEYDKVLCDEHTKDVFYNVSVSFLKLWSKFKKVNNEFLYTFSFISKQVIPVDYSKVQVQLGNINIESHFSHKSGIHLWKCFYYNRVQLKIKSHDILSMPIQNKMHFVYEDDDGHGFNLGIKYQQFRLRKTFKKSKILMVDNETCCHFRQSKSNTLFFTVRPNNKTDSFVENMKINLAFYYSKLFKGKPIYLLFEKDSARYEESASVVYQKMIDEGYENAYFILDRHYHDIQNIPEKYCKNIIYKYSMKHYIYFFRCQTFLGSEALVHAIELRVSNKHALHKINSPEVNYVFLQHGVMYMISLDSESRNFFKPRKINEKGKFRVVTSSVQEADHFISLGNYDPSQVIVCGLPKFDCNQWDENADKIVIMPTWRPWEYNEATTDFKETKYYKMIERIFDAIDDKYEDKIVILPHPLFFSAAQKDEFKLKKYMLFNVKYDEILRQTKILITDYSSIAYDAFYRGCNVIFYWEELQECLTEYGPSTKLMLNSSNVFGDICYNSEELKSVLSDNYQNGQLDKYVKNYSEIVSFHDGKNAERLISYLKNENII